MLLNIYVNIHHQSINVSTHNTIHQVMEHLFQKKKKITLHLLCYLHVLPRNTRQHLNASIRLLSHLLLSPLLLTVFFFFFFCLGHRWLTLLFILWWVHYSDAYICYRRTYITNFLPSFSSSTAAASSSPSIVHYLHFKLTQPCLNGCKNICWEYEKRQMIEWENVVVVWWSSWIWWCWWCWCAEVLFHTPFIHSFIHACSFTRFHKDH